MAWVPNIFKMPDKFLIIGILVLIIIYWSFSTKEGFTTGTYSTIEQAAANTLRDAKVNRVGDKANELAASENPITPSYSVGSTATIVRPARAVPVGVAESVGNFARQLGVAALNIPTYLADATGLLRQTTPSSVISPRIDDENSFLGMVKFCKDWGASNMDRPFDNAKFNENCGMCVTSGSLVDGTSYPAGGNPFGVLVYQQDKQQFWNEKSNNNYSFTHPIPSVNSAICVGAQTKNEPGASPSLAISQDEYDLYKRRSDCAKNGYGTPENPTGCGKCVIGTTVTESTPFSWIDLSGGYKSTSVYLWGRGSATVRIDGVSKGTKTLSTTDASIYDMGKVKEAQTFEIEVNSPTQDPIVYGAIYSNTPNGTGYALAVDEFVERDDATGRLPRYGSAITKNILDRPGVISYQMKPGVGLKTFKIKGPFPLTFVDTDQLASFDCPNGPFVLDADFDTGNPCANPPGQGPDRGYTDACLRKLILDGGCSTDGTWYSNIGNDTDLFRNDYGGSTAGNISSALNILKNKYTVASLTPVRKRQLFTDNSGEYVNYMRKCYNSDISSPCDEYVIGGTPNKECLNYLYTNNSSQPISDIIGSAYDGNQYGAGTTAYPYCQSAGSLNPASDAGATALINAVKAENEDKSDLHAVQNYLKDIYFKSTSDSYDIFLPSSLDHGSYEKYVQCIGTTDLAQVPTRPIVTAVSNTNNKVTVTWSSSVNVANPRAAITKYTVNGEDLGTITSKTYDVISSQNPTKQTYTVIAINIMGPSAAGTKEFMPYLLDGTELENNICVGYNRHKSLADGNGGSKSGALIMENDSTNCHYCPTVGQIASYGNCSYGSKPVYKYYQIPNGGCGTTQDGTTTDNCTSCSNPSYNSDDANGYRTWHSMSTNENGSCKETLSANGCTPNFTANSPGQCGYSFTCNRASEPAYDSEDYFGWYFGDEYGKKPRWTYEAKDAINMSQCGDVTYPSGPNGGRSLCSKRSPRYCSPGGCGENTPDCKPAEVVTASTTTSAATASTTTTAPPTIQVCVLNNSTFNACSESDGTLHTYKYKCTTVNCDECTSEFISSTCPQNGDCGSRNPGKCNYVAPATPSCPNNGVSSDPNSCPGCQMPYQDDNGCWRCDSCLQSWGGMS